MSAPAAYADRHHFALVKGVRCPVCSQPCNAWRDDRVPGVDDVCARGHRGRIEEAA